VARKRALLGKRVVITAGPTREYLDDVRFLSNASTGRMGRELARLAAQRGARVTLVIGPNALKPVRGVATVAVESTEEMLRATRAAAARADVVIFAAAPADWRPVKRRRGKPAREGDALQLALEPTRDIAATLGRGKRERVHVGFALEVARGQKRARDKLAKKRLDAIVLNGPANLGAGGGRATWIPAGGATASLPTSSKAILAHAILDRVQALLDAPRP
jgi:phosphopantothenoylcysteine decarboxylase / phosphopantothenate---cysteine ligase